MLSSIAQRSTTNTQSIRPCVSRSEHNRRHRIFIFCIPGGTRLGPRNQTMAHQESPACRRLAARSEPSCQYQGGTKWDGIDGRARRPATMWFEVRLVLWKMTSLSFEWRRSGLGVLVYASGIKSRLQIRWKQRVLVRTTTDSRTAGTLHQRSHRK